MMCTSLLIEAINYYRENISDCYLLLLDASKAFDRVEYVKLFQILQYVIEIYVLQYYDFFKLEDLLPYIDKETKQL